VRLEPLPGVRPRLPDARRVSLRGVEGLLWRGQPSRWRTRHIVGTLTRTPVSVAMRVPSSGNVRSGSSRTTWPEQALSRLVHAWCLPSGRRLRGNGPRRTGLAYHVLDAGETHPEYVRQGTRRAEPAFIGMEDFLT
jgi:hypothetical protein